MSNQENEIILNGEVIQAGDIKTEMGDLSPYTDQEIAIALELHKTMVRLEVRILKKLLQGARLDLRAEQKLRGAQEVFTLTVTDK